MKLTLGLLLLFLPCLSSFVSSSPAFALSEDVSLEALVKDFHALRLEHGLATRNGAEVPPALSRWLREVVVGLVRLGPSGENFLLTRLSLDRGELQGIVVEGLVTSPNARVSERVYREVQKLEAEAFETFFERVPLGHLQLQPTDLGVFVNSNPPWRRNGVMSLLARMGTPEAFHHLIECPLVDPRDSEFSDNAVLVTVGHFRTLLAGLTTKEAMQAVSTALTGKPRYFAKGAKEFPVETRVAVTTALGELGYEAASPVMTRNLSHHAPALANASAWALGRLQRSDAYDPIRKALKARSDVEFTLVALEALARIDAHRSKRLLMSNSKGKDWRIRSVVTKGLGLIVDPDSDARLLQLIADKSWQVRKAAFEALSKRPTRELIGALIASLDRQRGALRSRIYQALVMWTGENFGPEPERWAEFWKREGKTFSLLSTPGAAGQTRVDLGDPSRPRYFGMEILSQDVAFVVDVSGSMNLSYRVRGRDDKVRARPGIQAVKQELWDVVETLGNQHRFNVLSFATTYQPLFPKPTKPTSKSRRTASRFLGSLKARGATNLYGPLAQLIRGGRVESVYVLSDGEPTAGEYTEPEVILREIRRLNEYSHVTIHCFALGEASELLERLAAENGGEYRRIDEPEVVIELPETPAHRADSRRGHFRAEFTERSPLSKVAQQVSRDKFNGRSGPNDYDVTAQSWQVFVPEAYDGEKPFGLLVWVDPSPKGRIPYPERLADRDMIAVSANDSGNEASIWLRAGLALDAVHNLSKRFVIDPDRVFVSGFSGGGRMASRLGVMYADVFTGALSIDGTDWWEDLPADESPGRWFKGRYQKPKRAIWNQARKKRRYVLMTGERDGNRPGTKAAYIHGFKKAGFKHVVYIEVPGKGHEWPPASHFADALDYLHGK